jgi:hypothetical protein
MYMCATMHVYVCSVGFVGLACCGVLMVHWYYRGSAGPAARALDILGKENSAGKQLQAMQVLNHFLW